MTSVAKKICGSLSKQIVWFRTQDALFFSGFYSFETQRCKSSKKMRLEFETKQITKMAPGVWNQTIPYESPSQRKCAWSSNFALLGFELQMAPFFYSNNIVEVRTPGALFCRHAPRYLPRLKGFDFVSQMGTYPFVRNFLIPQLTTWFFN